MRAELFRHGSHRTAFVADVRYWRRIAYPQFRTAQPGKGRDRYLGRGAECPAEHCNRRRRSFRRRDCRGIGRNAQLYRAERLSGWSIYRAMHIYLVEGRDKLLATMSPETSSDCLKVLEKKGVNVMLNTAVKDYQDNRVIFGRRNIHSVRQPDLDQRCKKRGGRGDRQQRKERRGRILTDRYNRVQGFDNIFAIGDIAITDDPQYPAGYPQLARVAISQGERIAANLIAVSKGKPMEPYEYRSIGVLATVGRNRLSPNGEIPDQRLHGVVGLVFRAHSFPTRRAE